MKYGRLRVTAEFCTRPHKIYKLVSSCNFPAARGPHHQCLGDVYATKVAISLHVTMC